MQSCHLAKKIIQICVDALNKFLYVDAVASAVLTNIIALSDT